MPGQKQKKDPLRDIYYEALARAKDGFPLTKEQQKVYDEEGEKMRKFKASVAGLKNPIKPGGENLK